MSNGQNDCTRHTAVALAEDYPVFYVWHAVVVLAYLCGDPVSHFSVSAANFFTARVSIHVIASHHNGQHLLVSNDQNDCTPSLAMVGPAALVYTTRCGNERNGPSTVQHTIILCCWKRIRCCMSVGSRDNSSSHFYRCGITGTCTVWVIGDRVGRVGSC